MSAARMIASTKLRFLGRIRNSTLAEVKIVRGLFFEAIFYFDVITFEVADDKEKNMATDGKKQTW